MSMKRGYSLVVLVIAIAVILILSSVSITMLKTSRETIESADFIYDITTIEEMAKQYYTETGTLPVFLDKSVSIEEAMEAQLDLLDNENYYELDLGKIGNISIVNRERGYFLNEQTIRVYCKTPLEYAGNKYYTVTNELMGKEVDYQEQDEEITVAGNPLVWSNNARMRVVIPRKALEAKEEGESTEEFWSNWTFKWDFGPKSIDKLKSSNTAKSFYYGDTLVVKTNGVYTIYVNDPDNNETIINVVVTKVDDIKPKCLVVEGNLEIVDNETGIKNIYYKTRTEYDGNKEYANSVGETEGRDELDFFLLGGSGFNLIDDMPLDIQNYNTRYNAIKEQRSVENNRYNSMSAEEQAANSAEHDRILQDIDDAENSLKREYPYLADPSAEEEAGQLVLYVEDQAGNAVVIGDEETISFNMVATKYNLGTLVES
ncbi:MAG: type II secretion system protein [Clostridia bacterium]|nr:type II secretion system protein [Clostridia bacterium]